MDANTLTVIGFFVALIPGLASLYIQNKQIRARAASENLADQGKGAELFMHAAQIGADTSAGYAKRLEYAENRIDATEKQNEDAKKRIDELECLEEKQAKELAQLKEEQAQERRQWAGKKAEYVSVIDGLKTWIEDLCEDARTHGHEPVKMRDKE